MLSKRIFSLPTNLRNFVVTPQLNIVCRFSRINSITEQIKQTPESFTKNHKPLSNDIIVPTKIASLLERDKQIVCGEHLSAAMNNLVKLCKQDHIDEKTVQKQVFFNKLCQLIDSKIESLKTTEAIEIVRHLNRLQVPSSSKLISHLLRHVNDLLHTASLRDFCSIGELLSNMKPTPSTRAMTISLRKKFLIKISNEFDKENLEFLANALRYTVNTHNDRGILKTIISALKDHTFQNESTNNVVTLMKTLAQLDYYAPGWDTVLKRTQEHLIANTDKIHCDDILSIMRKSSLKVKNDRMAEFYDNKLYDVFIQKIILDDVNLEKAISCLDSCNIVRHTNKEILNYLAAKFYEKKYLDKKYIPFELQKLLVIISGLAYMKYKPIFWDEIFNSMKTKKTLDLKYETLIIYAMHLTCLGTYDTEVLGKIFSEKFNFQKNSYLHWTFLKLWQRLKVMPDYDGPMPILEIIDSFNDLERKHNSLLLPTLEQALGGSMYVKSHLRTKMFHFIDHAVVFRSGGYPVSINEKEQNNELEQKSIEYLEDLNVPPHCQVVAIIIVPHSWYARNTNQLLGPFSIYIESLEALSFKALPISDRVWSQVPENTRITFLMNEIKAKMDNSSINN